MATEERAPRVRTFVSYSHADGPFAARLVSDLEANNVSVWQDIKEITSGDSITEAIEGALRNCTAVILVLSPRSVKSSWVQREYRAALNLQNGVPRAVPRILPCVIADCDLPVFLRDIHYADFRTYEIGLRSVARSLGLSELKIPSTTFRADIERLARTIQTQAAALSMKGVQIPSHELFDVWSPLEAELREIVSRELAFSNRTSLDRSVWEIAGMTDNDGRPIIDSEPYPRNLFIYHIAAIAVQTFQIAERYGLHLDMPLQTPEMFRRLGGTPASN
jgi:hypothetical protein